MNETSDRIECPKCHANNFPSSAVCWQCGEPLPSRQPQAANETPGGLAPQPAPGYQPPSVAPPAGDQGQTLVIIGFILAALGFFCCPIVLSGAAIVLGIIAMNKGNKLGVWVIVAGVVSLIGGIIFGALVGMWAFTQQHANPYNFPRP